jgi:hypothetical protein
VHQAHGRAEGIGAGRGQRHAGGRRPHLLGPDGVEAFQPMGEVAEVALTPITVTGQPFSDAVRVDIKEGSSHDLRTETPQEGSVGETEFVFELASWTRVQVRFASVADYAPGEAQMIFRLGYDPQVIELGGVHVESYGEERAVDELPTSQRADRRRERAAARAARAAAANQTAIVEGGTLAFQIEPARVFRLPPLSAALFVCEER